MQLESLIQIKYNKKLYYCRKTAWHDVSVKIFPNAAQQCSNNLYDKSRTNQSNWNWQLQSTGVGFLWRKSLADQIAVDSCSDDSRCLIIKLKMLSNVYLKMINV